MERILSNASGALRLRRETYARLMWDGYATADAVLIVVAVAVVQLVAAVVVGRVGALGLLQGLLRLATGELIRWMAAALVMWLVSTKLLGGRGRIPATVGPTGYAYLPFVVSPLVRIALSVGGLSRYASFVEVAASLWFGLGLFVVAQVLFDLGRDRAFIAASVSVMGWWLVTLVIL